MPAQHQPSPGPGIFGQLAEEQLEEEQALQRLVTPRKHSSELPAAPGSGRRLMQALLSEEAEQAAALDQLLSPKRLQAAAHAVPGSTSRASCGLGINAERDTKPLHQCSLADQHGQGPFAGMYPLNLRILAGRGIMVYQESCSCAPSKLFMIHPIGPILQVPGLGVQGS